jgi:Ca-activated chloride channel family protein
LELHSEHALKDFAGIAKSYPLQVRKRTPHLVKAVSYGANVELREDFAVKFGFDAGQANQLRVTAEREDGDGFFEATALLGAPAKRAAEPAAASPRTVIVLFDNSLSMQWEKLERSFQACEATLRRLRPGDSFNLILFNSEVATFAPAPVSAAPAKVEAALDWIRKSNIRGGTDLQQALRAGLSQAAKAGSESYLLLLSDGGATESIIHTGKLAAWYTAEWKKLADPRRPHTLVFGIGDDANAALLRMLASNRGLAELVRSTEPIDFKLSAFLSKIGEEPVKGLTLAATPASNFEMIYPLEDVRFAGSMATWVGRYKSAAPQAQFTVKGMTAAVALPAQASDHPMLPRTWAKARVDALLAKIERDGEDRASIDEIIRLSKKYKFVSPYTSFLAVPRALLRPRVIRPGDPVLRVRTDESIVSVIALFPFGLVKPLRYLRGEDVWQTRFLAPVDMADGAHAVRLVLRDRAGHVYRESKTFVIASKAPVVRVTLDQTRARSGSVVRVMAQASANTRTITARLYGAEPAMLRWSSAAKANVGELIVPAGLPAGKYTVNVTAEDIAHNIGSREVALEIW